MNDKIEIADGFVSIKEKIWIVGRTYSDVTIDEGYIEDVYNDSRYGELASLFIKFKEGGSTSISGIDSEDLKEFCYIELEKAKIKQIELIMCE